MGAHDARHERLERVLPLRQLVGHQRRRIATFPDTVANREEREDAFGFVEELEFQMQLPKRFDVRPA